ncbi:MAG: hypothetical protein ACOYN0_01425 [Phycisphaerales bacterium]
MLLIDRYLARELSASEQEAFERRLDADPAFANELELQQRLDCSLRSGVNVQDLAAASLQLAAARAALNAPKSGLKPKEYPRLPTPAGAGKMWPFAGALAAGAVVVALIAVATMNRPASTPHATSPGALLGTSTFEPAINIEDAEALELLLAEKLSHRVDLPRGESIKYLGVRSDVGVSPLGLIVLAEVEGHRRVLVFDLAGAKTKATGVRLDSAGGTGVREHSRTESGVRIVEWTGDDLAGLLDQVRVY